MVRGIPTRYEGRILSGGIENDVTFVEVGDEVNDRVDVANWDEHVTDDEYGHQLG